MIVKKAFFIIFAFLISVSIPINSVSWRSITAQFRSNFGYLSSNEGGAFLMRPHAACLAGAFILATTNLTTALISNKISNKHHPAALAKKKLEIEIEEKRKKEAAQRAVQEKQQLFESKKRNAQATFAQLKHTYAAELELLNTNKLNTEKDALTRIIKGKYNTKPTPFACYQQALLHDLETMRDFDDPLLPGKEQERSTLISALEQILFTHNLMHADLQKIEQTKAHHLKKIEESELRQIEMEKLQLEKLRIEVRTAHETPKTLRDILIQLESLKNKMAVDHKVQNVSSSQLLIITEDTRRKLGLLGDEIKQTIKNSSQTQLAHQIKKQLDDLEETNSAKLEALKKQIQKSSSNQTSIMPTQSNPPAYNPELLRAMPAPSAPPL